MKSMMHYFSPLNPLLTRGRSTERAVLQDLSAAHSHFHIHTWKLPSLLLFFFIEKKLPQLGVKVSISAIAAEYCLFSFPLKKLGTFLLNAHFPWILFGIKT